MNEPLVLSSSPSLVGIVNFVLYHKSKVPTTAFLSPSWSRTALIMTIQNNVFVNDEENRKQFTPPQIALKGMNTNPSFINFTSDFIEVIGADLSPEALYILTGLDGSKFVNEYVDASSVWDMNECFAAIQNTETVEAKKSILEAFILSKVDEERLAEVDLFRRAIQCIMQSGFKITLPELYDDLAVTKMTLNRLFKKIVGIPPKQFLSLMLFEQMMKAKKVERESLEAIADSSFYDLSHINKWFKKYAACSPTEFVDANINLNENLLLGKKDIG